MKLIDKDALVAEIRGRFDEYSNSILKHYDACKEAKAQELGKILTIIDTFEVKEVELDKEIESLIKSSTWRLADKEDFLRVAKHFFGLGLKAQKIQDEIKIGETEIYLEDDGGEPPYDGIQWLDLSCMEYEIPKDKFKDGDNVEIIIRKAQKGK